VGNTQVASTEAIVITCIDRRVPGPIRRFLEKIGLAEGTWALQTIPGASLNLEDILSSIDLAVNLGARQILVFDHQDCAAYKQISREVECEHAKSLWDAQHLLEKFPEVEVRTFFMTPREGKEWDFEETYA